MHRNFNKARAAFSYIEVVVSLMIISMVALLLYFTYAVSVRSVNSSKQRIKTEIVRIKTDTVLRRSIENIIVPAWISEYEYSFNDNSINLSWVNGNQNITEIEIEKMVKIISVEPLKTKTDKILGFEIKYSIDVNEFETIAIFASRPYGESEI